MAACGDGELFRSGEADLYIEEGEESVLMQSGDFVLVLVQNAVSHLAAVVAMVGAVHWPVGRDCAVTRTGDASFSFSLPGPLCYALVFKGTSSAADLQRLEKVLQDYSTCSAAHQHPAAVAAGGQGKEDLKQAEKSVEVCGDRAGESRKSYGDELSPEMVGRRLRARRMSAIAKVFSKSLERGAINMANHVQPMDLATQDSRSNPLSLALAGVDAVAKVVDAVETGGRALLESALSMAVTEPSSAQGSRAGSPQGSSGLICSDWTLNKHGLLMLYKVITASMANSGLSSRSGSSRSGSSSSSELRRLLSSSSSSSLSSKSLMTSSPHTQAGADPRGSDTMSMATLPLAAAGTPPFPRPPPPPVFAAYAPRARMSDMPPPSGPIPPPPGPPSSFRIYKPRPKAAMAPPAGPPPFLPRPPRSQPPQS